MSEMPRYAEGHVMVSTSASGSRRGFDLHSAINRKASRYFGEQSFGRVRATAYILDIPNLEILASLASLTLC